jgi:hypothetical protein
VKRQAWSLPAGQLPGFLWVAGLSFYALLGSGDRRNAERRQTERAHCNAE